MPDLMKTPSNRRYVVNFQQKEPLNKYDIWLSFNKHNLDGNIVIDSEYLSDKDLVFKVFVDGRWVPILGIPVSYEGIIQALEELDKKKMNIVPPTEWEAGDITIFQQGSDECDQLVSGGTLEEMLQNIINGGGAIPIQRATTLQLGGIKAAIHSSSQLTDTYVEAKFKGVEGTTGENDRLYISAIEMADALHDIGGGGFELQLMGPSTRGGAMANELTGTFEANKVIPVLVRVTDEHLYLSGEDIINTLLYLLGNDPSIQLYVEGEGIDITDNVISNVQATDATTGGVRVDNKTQDLLLKNLGVEVFYGNNLLIDALTGETIDTKHLCITQEQLWALLNYTDEYTEPMFRSGFGIQPHAHHDYDSHTGVYDDYYTFDLEHSDPNDWGKYLRIRSDGSGIEWVNIPAGTVYPPLAANTTTGTECVVVAPDKKEGFLRWDGQFVAISSGSSVSWNEYQLTGTKIADITIDGVTTDIYAPQSNTYYSGNGIYIDNTNHINIITNGASPGDVLSYNGNGFSWVPQVSYTQKEGVIIDNVNHTIGGMITNNTNSYNASSSIAFNCTYGSPSNPITGIQMLLDNVEYDISKYSYNEVFIRALDTIQLSFNISSQRTFMQGIPIYVLLNVDGKASHIHVTVADTDSLGLININNAVVSNQLDGSVLNQSYSKFLITMQFGIVKIEPLEGTIEGSI